MFRWIRTKAALAVMHITKILVDLIVVVYFFCWAVAINKLSKYVLGIDSASADNLVKQLVYISPALFFFWGVLYWWIFTQGKGIRPALMSRLREHIFRMFRLI